MCKHKIQICCFPSFGSAYAYAYEITHITQGKFRNVFLSVCACVVLGLFLFKHMDILVRPLTWHRQDRYEHYMPCSSCLLSIFQFFLICFWQLIVNQKFKILNLSPNTRHLLWHQYYNFYLPINSKGIPCHFSF